MEDLDIYLYVILFLIYAASRIFKGVKKAPQRPPAPGSGQGKSSGSGSPSQSGQPKRKPFSFEDLLREFEEASKPREPETEDYEEKVIAPPPVPTKEIARQNSPYESYEGTSLEEIEEKLQEKTPIDTKLLVREEKKSRAMPLARKYAELIRDPEGAKKAIILSEIINRKYF